MKVAVIGSGISGNVCARLLSLKHVVHLVEAGTYLGRHTNTVLSGGYGQDRCRHLS
jgi:predicted NAD/FAD-binding protein